MNRFIRRVRRFFWWCAAADAEVLEAPDTPRLDGIKYAAIGALVCLTTTVAACGWMHNAATILGDRPYGIPIAVGLGLLMGALVFCMERVLVVSIRQDASPIAKFAAAAWRGLIASLAAAVVATPFIFGYFNNGILAYLDEEKLATMVEKRHQVADLVGLKDKTAAIAAADLDLERIREQRDHLPADVRELSAASVSCQREQGTLERSLRPKIAGANTQYAEIVRDIGEDPDRSAPLRRRLAVLKGQIANWKSTLSVKARACHDIAGRFETAKREYYARLDQQWQEKSALKKASQEHLDEARREAGVLLVQSDGVVARMTEPDLSARVRALGQMAIRDPFVAFVLAIVYAFFFLIDMMPVLAKLVMRTVYDRRISAEYRRMAAQIEADTVIAEVETAIRREIAAAERLGLEALLRQASGKTALDLATLRAKSAVDRAEVAAPFAQVETLIETFAKTQAKVDNATDRYAATRDSSPHIEAVRQALARAMQQAAAQAKSNQAATVSG